MTGIPQPLVEFYSSHDGLRLQTGSRLSVQHDASNKHWRLMIKDAKEGDLHEYKAVAKSSAGEVSCVATVRSKGPQIEKPKILEGLKQTKVKKKETAEMGVKVAVNPEVKPDVEWFKDGQKMEPEPDHIKIISDHETGKYTLKIVNAKANDKGEYTVKVTNKAGSDASNAKMAVEKEEFVAPEFVVPLENTDVVEHQNVDLKVHVTGKPEPQVEWFKDNQPVNIDNSRILKKDEQEGHHSLIIKDAQLADAGKYSCKAVNQAGQAESSAKFAVEEETSGPKFVNGLEPLEVKEAETAKFEVTVEGKPEPQVEWFKDGRPVQIDNQHVISAKNDKGEHSLTIKEARTEDAGTYSAKATNKAGTDQTAANFGVIEPVEAPKFIEPLSDFEIQPGQATQLQVKVVGKPEPQIAWLKNGKPVQVDGQRIISKQGEQGEHTLVVNNVSDSDAGTYTCVATNKAGEAKSVGDLKHGKEGITPETAEEVAPHFIEPLKQVQVEEGKPTELICKINPESKPEVKWFKDDQPIQSSQNIKFEQNEDGTVKLVIQSATAHDIGNYRCEAVNKAGSDKTIGALKFAQISEVEPMEELGGLLGFAKELQDQNVNANESATFECKLDEATVQVKDLDVKWAKDNQAIQKGEAVKQDDGTLKLVLDKIENEDAGQYKCTVTSGDSTAFTEAKLSVTGKYMLFLFPLFQLLIL